MDKMYCSYCESQIFEDDRTCSQCGAPTKNFFISYAKEITQNIKNVLRETGIKIVSLCTFPLNLKGMGEQIYSFQNFGEIKDVSEEEAMFIKEKHKNFLNFGYFQILEDIP